ncbi:MAG: DUF58 domain-containing protein [Planctomycetota bacterium]|nr:DUF58 domain-containing protein [Planctomycetota bacterium]
MTAFTAFHQHLRRRLEANLRRLRAAPLMSETQDVSRQIRYSVVVRVAWVFYNQQLTQAGRWFLWPTLLWAGYTSASLEIQAFVPFSYACGLWGVTFACAVLFRPRARVEAQMPERVGAGQALAVDATVRNEGRRAGLDWHLSAHRLPETLKALEPSGVPLPALSPGESARARLTLRCTRRGSYKLPRLRVETDFPFGLLRSYRVHEHEKPLLVYPAFHPLRRLDLPVGRRYQPGGVALASQIGESMEYLGNREYREGDNVRNIDWRATARLNQPIVREYREEYFYRIGVVLDTRLPSKDDFEAAEAFEQAVALAAAVGDALARQEYLVDLFAAGPNLYHLTAGRSLAYLDQILDILACVEGSPEEPFAAIQPELDEHLAQISTVVCIFLDWNEARRAFVHGLLEQGAGVKVAIVRDGACTLDPSADPGLGQVTRLSADDLAQRRVEEL